MAQGENPVPRQPILPRAPERAAWIINYRYNAADAPMGQPGKNRVQVQTDRILSIQVQKTGNIYHQTTNWSTGGQSEAWVIGEIDLVKERGAPGFAIKPSGPAVDDYTKSDFEDLSWLSMKYYVGLRKGEPSVFLFQAKDNERPRTRREQYDVEMLSPTQRTATDAHPEPSATKLPGPSKSDPSHVAADLFGDAQTTVALDAKTQLPVRYENGKITVNYQFTVPPVETLVPPVEVTALLRRRENYDKATTGHPAPP